MAVTPARKTQTKSRPKSHAKSKAVAKKSRRKLTAFQKQLIIVSIVVVSLVVILPTIILLHHQPWLDPDLIPHEAVVYYADFGAKGDGKTDDWAAICAAHTYANEHQLAVAANRGKTYYIGCAADEVKTHEQAAIIKTNTYWQDAKFIIDDKNMPNTKIKNTDLFIVQPDTTEQKLAIPDGYTLTKGQQNVGLKFDAPQMLYLVNKNKKDFIRSGVDENSGSDRQEVILVDKNGNVDRSTPVTWDYTTITTLNMLSVTEQPITVCGGIFTTIETATYWSYVNRGLLVKRSNTTVKGVKHYVTNESPQGSSYSGFYRAEKAHNVLFTDCVMWGRCTPVRAHMNNLTQGTYDILAKLANKVTWQNCTQGNDLNDGWGVMGSNHCRNLNMIGCQLSRFDAHQGVYNATIQDCTIRDISVVGFGKLTIDHVVKNAVKDADYGEKEFIGLRSDYGAFWNGDIEIKDCTMYSNAAINYLIKIVHRFNWDYGYECQMPAYVNLNNVAVIYSGNRKPPYPYFYVFNNLNVTKDTTFDAALPFAATKTVTATACSTTFLLTHNATGYLDNTNYTINS